MKSKIIAAALISGLCFTNLCVPVLANEPQIVQKQSTQLEDGDYTVDFTTDSSMFHVNETKDGKANLHVENGKMMVHITLASKNIVHLYPGTVKQAKKDKDNWLQPTTDTVTYDDGTTEEVYGFDVPVKKINKKFDLALVGTKGKWYDHKVKVSNPERTEEQ